MKKINVAIITNIPTPYRVALYYYIQNNINFIDLTVIYTNAKEDNRQWIIDKNKLGNSIILDSKVLKLKGKEDSRYIHLPINISKELRKIRPNVVIAFEYNPAAIQSLCWCKLYHVKFIHLTDGTLYSERNINKIQKLTRKIIINNADAYIASSTKAKEKLIKWGADKNKISLALLTTNVEKYSNIKRKPVKGRLLYVGSIIPRKGLDLLIKSLSYVKANYELHVVGNGLDDEICILKNLAKQNYVEDKIVWKGFKSGQDLLKEYAEAEIFILPTREDCFGLVLLEAAAAGVPIITSKYSDGAYDIVDNGKNGYIINPFNSEEFGKILTQMLIEKKYLIDFERVNIEKFKFSEVSNGYIEAIKMCKVSS